MESNNTDAVNNSKFSHFVNTAVAVVFTLTFLRLLVLILWKGYENIRQTYVYSCTRAEHIIIVLSFTSLVAALFVILIARRKILEKHSLRRISFLEKYNNRIIAGGVLLILAAQIFCVTQLRINIENDPAHILYMASKYARTGSFDFLTSSYRGYYAVKYPNNLGIIFLMSFLYRIEYLLTGSTSDFILLAVNVIAVNSSILMSVLLARRINGKKCAVAVLVICAVFLPFYTYTVYYYTDTLSMPFIVGALYLFKISEGVKSKKVRYSLTALVGAVLWLGFFIKGSAIILLCAIAAYIVFKFSFKRAVTSLACLVLGFGILFSGFSYLIKPALISKKMSRRYEYPYTHWVMMGLNRYGSFSKQDSRFTARRVSVRRKSHANIRVIKKRLKKMGKSGLIEHLDKKAMWTWSDGTYYVSHPIDNYINRSFLHEFFIMDGKHYFIFYDYSCAFQLFLILMMILSGLKLARDRKIDFSFILRLSVFGIFVFLLIWETRPRYLLNFTPIFILLAADGVRQTNAFLFSRRSKDVQKD